MNDLNNFDKLQQLSKDYYQHQISFSEYRLRRKEVLDKIDEQFNGKKPDVVELNEGQGESFLKKAFGLIRGNEVPE